MVEATAPNNSVTVRVPTEILALVAVQHSVDVGEIKAGESL